MAKGRKLIPKEIKELQGTARKDRISPDIPSFGKVINVTKAPSFLTAKEKTMYKALCTDLINGSVLENPDLSLVARLVVYNTEWFDSLSDIRKNGKFMVDAKSGRKVIKPEFTALMNMEKMIRDLESDLGLSPAARQRLKIMPKEPEKQKSEMQNLLD
jgi:P27 family predicted phage terminase small subunit